VPGKPWRRRSDVGSPAMGYSKSLALESWLTSRRKSIARIAEAHVAMGEVDGPGRPLELGRPLAHSYILRLVAEFQGFTRDLHDLSAEHIVSVAAPPPELNALLTAAITRGRAIDSGNATMTALRMDFGRLGVRNLEGKLGTINAAWARPGGKDPGKFDALVSLRNALAHGNQRQVDEYQRQVDEYRRQGHLDTVSWARNQLPVLNRLSRAFDTILWEHLRTRTGVPPW